MKKQDILENQANYAYLAIGSNLGKKIFNLISTKHKLSTNGINIVKSSSFYLTKSWPDSKFPDFINAVLFVRTYLSLTQLFKKIKVIEKSLGRVKTQKNYPRTCDIDIIDFNNSCKNIVHNGKKIITPHPRMHERNFTLIPLYEIKKNWIHPKNKQKIDILIKKLNPKSISDIKIYQSNGIIKYA